MSWPWQMRSTTFSQVPSQLNSLDTKQLERCNVLQGFTSIPAAPANARELKPLKLDIMMGLIKARRRELAMLANLARTLGKVTSPNALDSSFALE